VHTHPHTLVTGASTGIGRATVLRLAAAGQHVFAGVRKPADGAALARDNVTPVLLDVADADQIAEAARTVAEHVGAAGLDGLVNNAGIGLFGPLELVGVDAFRQLLEVNVTGQLAVTQALLPLLRQARGRIVMIGSIGARFTPPFTGPLAASKSALATLTDALRQELQPWRVGVVLVEPASVRTEAVGKLEHDARRLMDASPAAGRALYAKSFGHMVARFGGQHDHGSPPDVVARTIQHALTARRPRARYLSGENAHRMAFLAAAVPTPALDKVRRRLFA
jgi:NAD(P)-dependent dehydrogenase (short-subunit alcohol dehydrogenase family)